MRYRVLLLLLLIISGIAVVAVASTTKNDTNEDTYVVVNKKVICDLPDTMFEHLVIDGYRERPSWFGIDSKSKYILLSNDKTGTWTFIQYTQDIACILGAGEAHRPFIMGPKT